MTFTAEPITGRQVLDLSFLLTHAAHVLATRMAAAFAEIGITPREYCVLAHAMGGQYTQIELAKLADLDKTTMLNTMDYLERAGYAQRSPSPADRRARIITVTEAGAGLVAAGHEAADRVHRDGHLGAGADQRVSRRVGGGRGAWRCLYRGRRGRAAGAADGG